MNTADPDIRERRQREADTAAEREPLWRELNRPNPLPVSERVKHYPGETSIEVEVEPVRERSAWEVGL